MLMSIKLQALCFSDEIPNCRQSCCLTTSSTKSLRQQSIVALRGSKTSVWNLVCMSGGLRGGNALRPLGATSDFIDLQSNRRQQSGSRPQLNRHGGLEGCVPDGGGASLKMSSLQAERLERFSYEPFPVIWVTFKPFTIITTPFGCFNT